MHKVRVLERVIALNAIINVAVRALAQFFVRSVVPLVDAGRTHPSLSVGQSIGPQGELSVESCCVMTLVRNAHMVETNSEDTLVF